MSEPLVRPVDRALDTLERQESLALLSTVAIGQVVFTRRAIPDVVPVNFRVDGDAVVFRVAGDSALARTTDGTVLAFHADRIDEAARTGWSVTVVGRSTAVTDPAEHARISALPLTSWMAGTRDHIIRIAAEQVTGRRLT